MRGFLLKILCLYLSSREKEVERGGEVQENLLGSKKEREGVVNRCSEDLSGDPQGRREVKGSFEDRSGDPQGEMKVKRSLEDRSGDPQGEMKVKRSLEDRSGDPQGWKEGVEEDLKNS